MNVDRDEVDLQKATDGELLDIFTAADRTLNFRYAADVVQELLRRDPARSPSMIHDVPGWLSAHLGRLFWRQKDT